MKLDDFTRGDVLIVTSRSRAGEERRGAVVTAVNFEGNGYVTIVGHDVQGLMPTGSGAFKPEQVGTTPYGLTVAVEKVGFVPPRDHHYWYPKPGDTAYDLMC